VNPLVIDAHQHVWNLDRASYGWLGPDLPVINRTIEFDELRPQLRDAGVAATVLVQSADNAEDTDYMFEVAAAHPEVVGVVGWLPLDRAAEAAERLAVLRQNPLFVGVRSLIHDLPDPDWLLRPDVDEGLGLLEAAGVPFDLVAVLPRHLEIVPIVSARHPALRIVIDHLGKPPLGGPHPEPWWTLIAAAAENPNVFAKVSGLYPDAGPAERDPADQLRPVVQRAIEVFGADRLMYGGDWPISVLAGGYATAHRNLSDVFAGLSAGERDRLWCGTALEFYRLAPERLSILATTAAQ
jgi:L-fuconolactonase